MSVRRLAARVRDARPRGAAVLEGVRLVFDKPGRDGTAKANLAAAPGERVWGALYEIPRPQLSALDGFEAGYLRIVRPVRAREGGVVASHTYVWHGAPTRLPVSAAYLAHLLEGAEEHGLPEDYREALARVRTAPHPRR